MVSSSRPYLTLTLSAAVLALTFWPGGELLQWDRSAILARGEVWRVFSGHMAHWTPGHLLWDLLAFAALGAAVERIGRGLLACTLILSSLAVSLPLLFDPELAFYRGLSGVDSALFALLLVLHGFYRRQTSSRAWGLPLVLLALFLGKSAYEFATGETLFVAPSGTFTPSPEAHLLGAATGALAGFCRLRIPIVASYRGGRYADS